MKEYRFLEILMQNKGQSITAQKAYSHFENDISWQDFLKLIDEFHNRGLTDESSDDLLISPVGEKHYTLLKQKIKDENETEDEEKKIRKEQAKPWYLKASFIIPVIISLFALFKDYLFPIEKTNNTMTRQEVKEIVDSLLSQSNSLNGNTSLDSLRKESASRDSILSTRDSPILIQDKASN